MLSSSLRVSTSCATCRLRQTIAAKQLLRCRKNGLLSLQARVFSLSTERRLDPTTESTGSRGSRHVEAIRDLIQELDGLVLGKGVQHSEGRLEEHNPRSLEEAALHARETFGDSLPEGLLSEAEQKVYERLYGRPLKFGDGGQEEVEMEALDEDGLESTGLLREGKDGALEEVEFDEEAALEDEEAGQGEEEEALYASKGDARLAGDIQSALNEHDPREESADMEEEDDDPTARTHPLTLVNRFSTSPSTLYLPQAGLVEPVTTMLSAIDPKHLSQASHRVFGGIGLPDSTSTPALGKTKQQKAIPLDASQGRMSEIEADTYMAVLMPAMYSSVMSVLVETRKRLGTAWAEGMVKKAEAGTLQILDAGAGGVGALAVREMLKAEWERMHEKSGSEEADVALPDGKLGGASLSPPLGSATVLTGSDTLRARASQLLENTTFVPRLPDYVHTETAKQGGKFDIVVAPHTLWPIREDWQRKTHVDNLWSLLKSEGGVLLMLEKGVARGFEAIASARNMLLDSRIANPELTETSDDIKQPDIVWDDTAKRQKESGMIIAPCTNHSGCPMYTGGMQGVVKGRKDICHFEQRYIRPNYLQKILGARDKNYEDVKFSYLAVMRGRDLRKAQPVDGTLNTTAIEQGPAATDRAFAGYGDLPTLTPTTPGPSSLSLPRAILPPLKRRGHVILDLCTPAGTLERWTVPRSFSRQAYRDARKSSWGDLWALGAKSRVVRTLRTDKHQRRKEKAENEGLLGGKVEGSGEVREAKLVDGKAPGTTPSKTPGKGPGKKKQKEMRRIKERKAGKQGKLIKRDE